MAHECNPSKWEAGTGRSGVRGQPALQSEFQAVGLHSESLPQKERKEAGPGAHL